MEPKPPTYQPFLPASESASLVQLVEDQRSAEYLIRLLRYFQKMLGLEIGFKIPLALGNKASAWKGVLLLQKMKRLGLIEKWSDSLSSSYYPDEPPLHIHHVMNALEQDTIRYGLNGAGFHFFSEPTALWASIGEAIERHSLASYTPPKGTYRDTNFATLGSAALDLHSLAGIDPALRSKDPQLSYSPETNFRFVSCYSLTRQEKKWVPLQLVSFLRHSAFPEPLLRRLVSTGAATHSTLEEALLGGILELIERDAFMITWLNTISPFSIQLNETKNDALREVLTKMNRYRLETHFLLLPTDFKEISVVLAIIIDRSGVGPAVCVGAKASFDPAEAVLSSVTEALASRISIRYLHEKALKEKRDLSFTDKESIGREERLLYWCDKKMIPKIEFLLKGKRIEFDSLSPSSYASASTAKKNAFLINAFKEKKIELAYAEILPLELKKKLGLVSLITIAPELQPVILNETPPHHWGPRIFSVPQSLDIPVSGNLNLEVHPFP